MSRLLRRCCALMLVTILFSDPRPAQADDYLVGELLAFLDENQVNTDWFGDTSSIDPTYDTVFLSDNPYDTVFFDGEIEDEFWMWSVYWWFQGQ